MWNVTETPWLGLIVAGLAFGIVMMIRQAAPDKRNWKQLAIPALIVAVTLGLDYFVRTDREKIVEVFRQARRMGVTKDFSSFNQIFWADYRDSRNRNREELRRFCEQSLAMTSVSSVRVRSQELTIRDGTATGDIRLRVWLHYRGEELDVQTPYWVRLRGEFVRQPDGEWRIAGTEIVSVNDDPMGWKEIP
jgi:hypothetical protein